MKRALILAVVAVTLAAPALPAQNNRDHIELGVFADYFRLASAGDTGLWGIGGRAGLGLAPHVNLEADMAYDFERNVTSTGTRTNLGITTTFTQVNGVRLWHGLFGPMVWAGSKHARVFGELKGGFVNFSVSGVSVVTGFTNVVGDFFTDSTNGAFYPGGGAELSVGPFGLRFDVGDFMYFNNGTHHNLSVKAGPTIHF
jgi:hypothetical protein